jgi:RNA polymerase sigma-70 factor (ECF subfamily)
MEKKLLIKTVKAAQKHDETAMRLLYNEYAKSIYHLALKLLQNKEDAEDMMQETFITAFTKLQKLKEPATFRNWLGKIASNKCTDLLRKRHGGMDADIWDLGEDIPAEESPLMLPESSLDNKESARLISDIVDSLPTPQKMCVYYHYYQELPIKQVAEVLNANEHTVRSRLNLAKQKIREKLEALETKEGIKLYSAAPAAFTALLKTSEQMSELPPPALETAWEGISATSGVLVPVATAGFSVKIAITLICTFAVTVGGIIAVNMLRNDDIDVDLDVTPEPDVIQVFEIEETRRAEIERYIEILSAPGVGSPFSAPNDMTMFGVPISFTPASFAHPSELPAGFFVYRYMCDVIYRLPHQLNFGFHTINIDDLVAHTREYYWADFSAEMLDFDAPEDWIENYDEEARTFTLRGGTRGGDIQFFMGGGVFDIIEMYPLDGLYYALTTYGVVPWNEAEYRFADIMHVFEVNENGNLNLVSKLPYTGELPAWLAGAQEFILDLAQDMDALLIKESPHYIAPLGRWIDFDLSEHGVHGMFFQELLKMFREYYGTPAPQVLDLGTEFIYLNITMAEADALFGEPSAIENNGDYHYREYEGVTCTYYPDSDGNLFLHQLTFTAGDFTPVRGIRLGDSLNSVLAKIPLDTFDGISYRGEMSIDGGESYFSGTSLIYFNNSDYNTVEGNFNLDFNEDNELVQIRILILNLSPHSVAPFVLTPLDMLGGYHEVEHAGGNYNQLNEFPEVDEFNPELYRQLFFGTWDSWAYNQVRLRGTIIIDESEQSHLPSPYLTGYIGRVGADESIIVMQYIAGGIFNIHWIDINEPDVMYSSGEVFTTVHIYNRADTPVNTPREYLSLIQINELAHEYGFDYKLITDMEMDLSNGRRLYMDNYYFSAATRLISEEENRLAFHALLHVVDGNNDVDEITFTIERIDGEWVRTIESDAEL